MVERFYFIILRRLNYIIFIFFKNISLTDISLIEIYYSLIIKVFILNSFKKK